MTIKLTYEEFCEQFRPLKNPFDEEARADGTVLDKFGEQGKYALEHVGEEKVWTLYNNGTIGAGCHYVNASGYIITTLPRKYPENEYANIFMSEMYACLLVYVLAEPFDEGGFGDGFGGSWVLKDIAFPRSVWGEGGWGIDGNLEDKNLTHEERGIINRWLYENFDKWGKDVLPNTARMVDTILCSLSYWV